MRDYISRLVKGVATGQRVIAAATQTLLLGQRAGETDDIIVQVVSSNLRCRVSPSCTNVFSLFSLYSHNGG